MYHVFLNDLFILTLPLNTTHKRPILHTSQKMYQKITPFSSKCFLIQIQIQRERVKHLKAIILFTTNTTCRQDKSKQLEK